MMENSKKKKKKKIVDQTWLDGKKKSFSVIQQQ